MVNLPSNLAFNDLLLKRKIYPSNKMSDLPTWSTTTMKVNKNKKKGFFNRISNFSNKTRSAVGKKIPGLGRIFNVTPWKAPTFLSYNQCKKPNAKNQTYCRSENGMIIQHKNQMVNFKKEGASNYESTFKRYYRSQNYKPNTANVRVTRKNKPTETIPINPATLHFYSAVAPELGKKTKAPVYFTNRNKVTKNTRKEDLDFTAYQKRLEDPSTRDAATKELRLLQQMLVDARVLKREELETKYKRTKTAQDVTALLAAGLGLGTGFSSNVVASSLGKTGAALGLVSFVQNKRIRSFANYTAAAVLAGEKIAQSLLVTAATVGSGGIAIPVTAVVIGSVSVGLGLYAKRVEKQQLTTEMNGDELMKMIDDLIKDNGQLILEENPLFVKARLVKAKLDAAIENQKEKFNLKSFRNTLPLNEQTEANILYEQMMENKIEQAAPPLEIQAKLQ
jgi:hypothetical protein